MVPALTSYSAGQMFYFVAAGDNTGAVTINIDSLGAKSVTRDGSTALVAGDIVSGEVALIVYDGTRFQLLNGNSFTNLNVSNNLTLSGGTANGVLYLNGSKVATSGTGLEFSGTNFGVGTAGNAINHRSVIYFGGVNAVYQMIANGSTGLGANNGLRIGLTSAGVGELYSPTALVTYIDNTERMRLDTSGNLGLGVNPSPWGSNFKAFESAGASSVALAAANINGVGIISNAYATNANWLYSTTGTASRYSVNTNIHQWQNAVSGTANSVISWATLMTLDAGGNLGINVTPAAKLHVDSGATDEVARFNSTGNPYISVHDSGVRQFYIQSLASDVDFVVEANKALSFYTNNTKRVNITALGSVVAGNGALATTATDGFLYVPTCAGTPTGTPTTITGMAPIVVNTTNNKLYFYSGGSWRDAGP
jgi:hypothetical protein